MAKNIKITEEQYKLIEADFDKQFNYVNADDDTKHYDGLVNVSSDGKLDINTNASVKTTGDNEAAMLTPQSWSRYRTYGNLYPRPASMRESEENDFYDTNSVPSKSAELDILSDGNENDDLVKIPAGVDKKSDILLDAVKSLSPKQQAIVLNKMIEGLDTDNIPYQWKKELIEKLK